jgi:hypothetical protein
VSVRKPDDPAFGCILYTKNLVKISPVEIHVPEVVYLSVGVYPSRPETKFSLIRSPHARDIDN